MDIPDGPPSAPSPPRTREQARRGELQLDELRTSTLSLEQAQDADRLAKRLFESDKSSRDRLELLLEGDPLAIRPRACTFLRENALLVEPERLWLRSATRAAIYGAFLDGETLDGFLSQTIGEAVRDLMEDNVSALEGQVLFDPETVGEHAIVVELFGVETQVARRVETAFNALDGRTRQLVFDTVVRGRSIEDLAQADASEPDELDRLIRESLAKITDPAAPLPGQPDPQAPPMSPEEYFGMDDPFGLGDFR